VQEVIRPSSGKPFAPNAGFQLSTAQHKQLVEAFWTAARKSFPLIVLTGPEGVGKTALVRHLKWVAPPDVSVANISAEGTGRSELRAIAAAAERPLAARSGATGPSNIESLIEDYKRHLLLIFDDAEKFVDGSLNVLIEFLELGSKGPSAPTLLLVGSPRLEALLMGSRFSALMRRRGVLFRFHPMTAEETSAYIRRRLQIAGLDPETFDDAAVEIIHRAAFGLPKQVDSLCSKALAAMLDDGRQTVDSAQLEAAVARAHGKSPSIRLTDLKNDRRPSEIDQSKLENSSIDESTRDQLGFLPVVEPSEFVFLSRDRLEASGSAGEPGFGPIAGIGPKNESLPILQPADSQRPGREKAPQNGAQPPHIAKAAAPSVVGGIGQEMQSAPEPRHRSLFASRTGQVSAALGGVAATAILGIAIAAMLGGGRIDGFFRGAGGEPHQGGEAEISGAGTASAVDLSPSSGRIPSTSGFNDGAYGEVASAQIGVPADGPVASKLWQHAGGSLDTASLLLDELETVPPDQVAADQFFRQGLELAIRDRRAAVVAFSRAAIRGHARSAYYLGQIYETGDGVPADTALARAWYALAGDHARARQRLAELTEQRVAFEQNGESQAEPPPQLAFAERSSAGILDLVWIADRGAASAGGYIVELAEEPEGSPVIRAFAEVSALRLAYPDTDELWWRVTPVGRTAASSWQRVPYAD
jgi:type II secretory pathway predicted ATPase ExeA